ncbi:hypothetical protein RB195_015838 [Necator americanus]|uniref:Uncharacterized protein n=1 Tax=Necator americanus TaxID=51031 RepID=A0ABR1E6P4_NECAM
MRRKVKRWKSAPSRHVKVVGDTILYKPLKVKLLDQEKPRIEDFDPFPPTCSSSEDHDRISPPRNEPTLTGQDPLHDDFVRFRGGSVGSSLRDYSPRRDTLLSQINYNGPERSADGPMLSALPPRAPIRNTMATASLRTRPPPPPYTAGNGRQKPPPYPGRNAPNSASNCSTPLPSSFVPQSASTPKSDKGSPVKECELPVVAEGEKRTFVREKEERLDKAMSIYENVSQAEVRANESTVWYEYGCV